MGASWSYYLAKLVSHVVGHVYPAYASYKAVKSGDPAEHRQWLMYWTVNTLLSVIEALLDMVASWVPLYYEAKIVFIIWLTAPQTRGASVLYDLLVSSWLLQYEAEIDQSIDRVGTAAGATLERVKQVGSQHLRQQSVGILGAVSSFLSPAQPQDTNNSTGEHTE